jgi:hypothetical protein
MENGGLAFHHDRMPGVVAALEPGDYIRLERIKIDNLSFSFIPPLGTDNRNIGHEIFSFLHLDRCDGNDMRQFPQRVQNIRPDR